VDPRARGESLGVAEFARIAEAGPMTGDRAGPMTSDWGGP
jgi:hypothetical protein